MALIYADRVQETTATTGTGTLTLDGASVQYQSFSTGIGNGNNTDYCILSGNGIDWQTANGTVTVSGGVTTLTRDLTFESTNSNTDISLSGTSTVFVTPLAKRASKTPSIIQSATDAQDTTTSGSTKATPTFSSTPIVGNLLIFIVASYQESITPPSGVTLLDQQSNDSQQISCYQRVVQSGDGTAWGFYDPNQNNFPVSVFAVEISGATALFANHANLGHAASSGATQAGIAASPGISGTIVFAAFTADSATNGTQSSGWTLDTFLKPSSGPNQNHPLVVMHETYTLGDIPSVTWTGVSTSFNVQTTMVSVGSL